MTHPAHLASNGATRRSRSPRAHYALRFSLAILIATSLTACTSTTTQSSDPFGPTDPSQNADVTPNRPLEVAAHLDSEDRLTKVQFGVIEKGGPNAVWESLGRRKALSPDDIATTQPTLDPEDAFQTTLYTLPTPPTTKPATPAPTPAPQPSSPAPQATAPAPQPTAPAPQPSALIPQPSSPLPGVPPAAAGQVNAADKPLVVVLNTAPTPPPTVVVQAPPPPPITAPLKPIDERGLPIRAVEMPDGKVRLIWTLRSYGGATVTSTRDPSTARRQVSVAPSDLAPLCALIQQFTGPQGQVTALPRENILVITCDKNLRSSVLELLSKLDVPPMQVEISAKVFEVSRDFDFQLGAQVLAKRIGDQSTQTGLSLFNTQKLLESAAPGGQPFQGGILSLTRTFERHGIAMDASFEILAEAGLIRAVSAPRMTVAAGQTGYMLAGQELPIQSASLSGSVLTTSTQYKPVGVQLYITPQAVGPKRIKLHTISIVSSVTGFAPLPTLTGGTKPNALVNPVIESREAETAVTVDDGETLVISGLRMMRTITREAKVPGLGDIPFLGFMFKNQRSQQQQTDLYFFVTPMLL